jgi:hypothetical protein
MKPLDEELKSALRRVEPPAGFAERVLEQARREADSKPGIAHWLSGWWRPQTLRWAAAFGFACILAAAGMVRYRENRQARIQGELAGAQARLALQIASSKLNAVLKDAAQPARRNLEN